MTPAEKNQYISTLLKDKELAPICLVLGAILYLAGQAMKNHYSMTVDFNNGTLSLSPNLIN